MKIAQKNYSRERRASYMFTSGRKAKEVMMEPFQKKWGSSYLVQFQCNFSFASYCKVV